jgi:DNA-directed RNA polymerase subunit K/omega
MADDNSDFLDDRDDEFENDDLIEDINESSQFALKKLYQHHPECQLDYIEDIATRTPLTIVPAGPINHNVKGGNEEETEDAELKDDKFHKTYPFLTVYEKTKIIGMRANQLSQGACPFIKVPDHVKSVKEIARLELEQKRLPYIIKRPLPNGECEYWRLSDLMIL